MTRKTKKGFKKMLMKGIKVFQYKKKKTFFSYGFVLKITFF